MSVSVLTESNFDGMLLSTLLADEQARGDIEVRVVHGLTAGYSVARTLLAVNRIPVALVIDADSPEQEAASERKWSAEEVIGDVSGGVPFRVVVAIPELEILFFESPGLLQRVFGAIDPHVLELAQLSPRRAIGKLAPNESYETARFRILRAMRPADVEVLRKTEVIRDLLDFIEVSGASPQRPAVSKA